MSGKPAKSMENCSSIRAAAYSANEAKHQNRIYGYWQTAEKDVDIYLVATFIFYFFPAAWIICKSADAASGQISIVCKCVKVKWGQALLQLIFSTQ